MDKDVFDTAWKHMIHAFPDSPRFSAEQVTRNQNFLDQFSRVKYTVDPKRVYTNEFLEK